MTAGYTGHYNNLDYSICFEQQYGFCGIEFSPADRHEIGSFSLTNEFSERIAKSDREKVWKTAGRG